MAAALDLAVRAGVVLTLAWLTVALLRRHAASRRALIWTVAFGSLLALPLFARFMPEWQVAVWQEPATVHVVNVRSEEPARTVPVVISREATPRLEVSRVFVPEAGASAPLPPAPPAQPVDWSRIALLISALVTILLLARIAASHLRMSRLLAVTSPAGQGWTDLIDELRESRGIRRSVAARISDAINVPAIAGVFRPTLILPGEAAEWDGALRRAVVLHELAHVARWDALAQLVEQIACALYWFIPLAWHGARRAAALRERASDDEVIRAGMPAPAYAERLLDLVRAAGAPDHQLATVAMARPSRMRERVTALLDPVARREALTMRTVAAAVILSSCAVAAIAAAAPAQTESLYLQPAAMAVPEPARFPADRSAAIPAMPAAAPEMPAGAALDPIAAETAHHGGAQALRLCGADIDNHQQLSNTRNGRRTLTVKLSGGGCSVDLKSEGRITFNDDFTDIAALESGGFFRLDVKDRSDTRRQLEIESPGGTLTRTWRVDGREQPYDADARRWFAEFLIDLDRRTAIGVDVRLPHLLRQGGVRAVLDETGVIPNDYVRNVYYLRLAKAANLSTADVARVLQQAAKLTKSDHYANELLQSVAGRGLSDAAQRAAVTQLIGTMNSDHYIAEAVQVLVASGRPSGSEMDFLAQMLPRMKSDHYKTQVLTKVLKGATLTADQQAQLANAAADIESDHYASEFLRQLIRARGTTGGVRLSFLEAVRGIQSDHYRTETLSALLEQPDVSERELLIIVDLSSPMSDHYESEALRKIVRHRNANRLVREAVMVSAERLSSHYRGEVRRAAGER